MAAATFSCTATRLDITAMGKDAPCPVAPEAATAAVPCALPVHDKYLQYAQDCGLLEDTGESTHASGCTEADLQSMRPSPAAAATLQEVHSVLHAESAPLQRKRSRTLDTCGEQPPACRVREDVSPCSSSAGSSQDSWDAHEYDAQPQDLGCLPALAPQLSASAQPLPGSGCTACTSTMPHSGSSGRLSSVTEAECANDGLNSSSSAVGGSALRPSGTASASNDSATTTSPGDDSAHLLGLFASEHLTAENAIILFRQAASRAAGSSFYLQMAIKVAEFVLDNFAAVQASLGFSHLIHADAEGRTLLASSMAQHLSSDKRPKSYKLKWCEPGLVFTLCHASHPAFLQIDHYPLACCLARAGYATAMQAQFQRLWASPAHQDVVEECVLSDCYLTFYLAVEMGHVAVAQLLLNSCYNPDIRHGILCSRGFEALRLSIANGHAVLAEFLLNSLAEEQRCDLLMAYGITLVNAAAEPLSHPILLALLKRIRVCELRGMLPWLTRRAQLAIAVALGLAPAPGAPGAVGTISQAEATALERLMSSLSVHAVTSTPSEAVPRS